MAAHPPTTNGHGGALSVRLEKLIAHHEGIAAACRTVLGELGGVAAAAKHNGHSAVLASALALDAARTNGKRPKPKAAAAGSKSRKNVAVIREQTAGFLAAFDRKTPRTLDEIVAAIGAPEGSTRGRFGLGTLKRHGYLKKKRGGYVRTAKPYAIKPWEHATP